MTFNSDWRPLDDERVVQHPKAARPKFPVERWGDILFDGREEWAIKRLLPRVGLAAIFGRPASFKSFVASHVALCVALGWDWAGRRVNQTSVVYIASEAAAGLRKRKAGFQIAHPALPQDVPLSLVPAAPNLGSEKGDLPALIQSIEAAGVTPGVVVLDTLAASLGSGDENGSGMVSFVGNAGALAQHFQCLVIIVHHTGLADDKRMRGHSSLLGALDAAILCERVDGDLASTLTLTKIKDDASDVKLLARLSRVVIAHDEEGDEISTLVVDTVEDIETTGSAPRPKPVPASQRLLMACVVDAIEEAGESFRPFGASGPLVRGVADSIVRERLYQRIAETSDPSEDMDKVAERQRKAFNRSLADALKAERVMAVERGGRRFVWLP